MQLNLKKPLAFFDLETTGVNVASDRIVEIAILKVFPDGHIEKRPDPALGKARLLINPGIPIPAETSAIHGIFDEDVKDAPTFEELSGKLFKFLFDCDLAGFNSNKFDVPILAEEFLRCGIDFSVEGRNLIDVQNIFHLMEQRTLKAGYKFYCKKDMENAHEAMADVEATHDVFMAQLEKYADTEIEDRDGNMIKPVANDMQHLHFTSQRHRNVDMLGRIIYNDKDEEIFNFGKHKGKTVKEVLKTEPGYYGWMLNGDFPLYTKKVLKDIKERLSYEQ
ncbi:3'-5' exonuclease [Cryomorpha ignava]|uniref:3'-5' exonuclease n=1 Tax=Cryomorpha ignava TaxID=101383 RepID=A0A7K3WW84_9FLAO|nr:3'-5' exonuclease [Cryomorpha ignava]NEN24865.1 3'-5' exonuclease [Cryomorpha ignava]